MCVNKLPGILHPKARRRESNPAPYHYGTEPHSGDGKGCSDVVLKTRVLVSRRLEDKNESLGLGLGS